MPFDNTYSIRYAIIKRMGELRCSTYKLAQLVKGEMCQATVYNFIEGMTDVGAGKASRMLFALGLVVEIKTKGRG